jgi:predicted RNase H-like nuclease (RuvC/YqgF family)
LKQDYLLQQRQVFETSSEVYSFHDVNLLTELKLANDNLRWRLQQRNHIIESKNAAIAQLTKQCKAYEERIAALEEEINSNKHVSVHLTAGRTAAVLPRIVRNADADNHNHNNHTQQGQQQSTTTSSNATSQSVDLLAAKTDADPVVAEEEEEFDFPTDSRAKRRRTLGLMS